MRYHFYWFDNFTTIETVRFFLTFWKNQKSDFYVLHYYIYYIFFNVIHYKGDYFLEWLLLEILFDKSVKGGFKMKSRLSKSIKECHNKLVMDEAGSF